MARALGALAEKGAAHLLILQFEKDVTGFQVGVDRPFDGLRTGLIRATSAATASAAASRSRRLSICA
ncbi:hypothetical protein MBESOW_P2298 [Sphingobium xenophagum]|uniref:Uncharacterized protein n=1 Tax=Sphingobium xenophagum TaxID=121428 RepID=A0A401J336_SPHXE|nr:hypothetical protein MBESOW_P2298 [Sphingobium xenophagum]